MSPGHTHETDSHARCRALTAVLERIADKWTIQVVRALGKRTLRFNELKREIDGVSQRMLTRTLRNLERDGLVARAVQPTVPPRVDYSLTQLGQKLTKPLGDLASWAEDHLEELERARQMREP